MKKKFGEILLERGLINPQQLGDALDLQRRRGMRLGAALVARGHLSEHQLVNALGAALNIKVVELGDMHIAPAVIQLVQQRFCLEHELIPYAIRKERGRRVVSVAMSDPLNYRVIDEMSFVTDSLIEPALARASDIDAAITRYYGRRGGTHAFGKDNDGSDLLRHPSNEDPSDPTMAILRRGGVEEIVDTTGKMISPFIKGPEGELIDNPEARPEVTNSRVPRPRPQTLLLTEEVPPSTPVSPATRPQMAIPKVPTAPGMVPTRVPPTPPPQPQPPPQPAQLQAAVTFDDALGALIDAQGGAVNAEAFRELEKKFWALMRILARKGILTNEDFVRELRERE